MIFKNLSIYKTVTRLSQKALDEFLLKHKFEPCLPNQESSAGFATIFGLESRVFSVNDCHLFCLKVDEKVIPPSAIKAEVKRRREYLEKNRERKLSPSERDELREEVKSALCEVAFCRPADLWAYLDAKKGILVVNTTSAKSAAGLSSIIAGSMPGKLITPLSPSSEIREVMTGWLRSGRAELPLVLGDKCEITDGKGVIRYKDRLLSDAKLQAYLEEGLVADSLSLVMPEQYSFVLTKDFVLKEFSIDEDVIKSIRVKGSGPMEILALEFREMSEQVRLILDICEKLFEKS